MCSVKKVRELSVHETVTLCFDLVILEEVMIVTGFPVILWPVRDVIPRLNQAVLFPKASLFCVSSRQCWAKQCVRL